MSRHITQQGRIVYDRATHRFKVADVLRIVRGLLKAALGDYTSILDIVLQTVKGTVEIAVADVESGIIGVFLSTLFKRVLGRIAELVTWTDMKILADANLEQLIQYYPPAIQSAYSQTYLI